MNRNSMLIAALVTASLALPAWAEPYWICAGTFASPASSGIGGTCSSAQSAARSAARSDFNNGNYCWDNGWDVCELVVVDSQPCQIISGGLCEAKARVEYKCWVCVASSPDYYSDCPFS
jgi:hypothetical protein